MPNAISTYFAAHGCLPPQFTPHRVAVALLAHLGRDWPDGTVRACGAQFPHLHQLEHRLERACIRDNPKAAWHYAWAWLRAWREAALQVSDVGRAVV